MVVVDGHKERGIAVHTGVVNDGAKLDKQFDCAQVAKHRFGSRVVNHINQGNEN